MSSNHPYTSLPSNAFWKTAVAELGWLDIDLGWRPKTLIDRSTTIVTAGSCFAQHIGKSLRENGFNWHDAEPAPFGLPEADHAKSGYGVFSFRTGNIYTAALLKQWVMWATGREAQSTESFEHSGRYFDPFRPSIFPGGFASAADMLDARKLTLEAMLDALTHADVFIFTLGLTEAWLNTAGFVYPMCPGTIRGRFSATEHRYHNFHEQEVVRDLTITFELLREINPHVSLLLTVSPVPLTATASGQHVLIATTYSKSVLRSAAGFLCNMRADTDYFPSYELITAPAFKGRFFEPNMRSVSVEGVQFVMGQFLASLEPNARHAEPVVVHGEPSAAPESDICDDIILEAWSSRVADPNGAPPNILLLGDSQMGMIAKVLDERGIRYAGGAIMHGSEWHDQKFTLLDKAPYFMPTGTEARLRWEHASEDIFQALAEERRKDVWILTNIGFHAHSIISETGFGSYLRKKYGDTLVAEPMEVRISDLRDYLVSAHALHLELVFGLQRAGFRVVWLGDPPVDIRNYGFMGAAEGILLEILSARGCLVFPSWQWIDEKFGKLPPTFQSDAIDPASGALDVIHGSLEYYRQLLTAIFEEFSIPNG